MDTEQFAALTATIVNLQLRVEALEELVRELAGLNQ